jgi:ArsR family transcriptional regulator
MEVLVADRPQELAELFKAVADPTRLRLVKLLAESSRSLCVNALTARLEVSQSAVSQHLRVLRQAGLVSGERRGNRVHYSLDERRIAQVTRLFMDTLGKHL